MIYDTVSLFLVIFKIFSYLLKKFVTVFLDYNQCLPGGIMVFVVLCPGAPEGSTSSGYGFKVSQKMGPQLKSLIPQTGRS